VIIPNGFDVDRFQPNPQARQDLRGQLALDDRVPVIGMAARFHPMKDHLTFLRAAKLVHSQHPEAHFLLVGPNVDKNNLQLQEAIQSSGLEKQVHLLGERQDMPAIYSALDIASLSSAWGEGFPNVIGEAMACGIPCAVTDIGDAGLVVGDCGFSVPAREPQSLAAAWCKLLEMGPDGRRELGRRARQRVIDLYALPAIVRQYETLYERTLEAQ
jgi:glycosyltransferase involved in cell wall biosynthesis